MTLKGRRILVTGADGFIGSHLVEELIRSGADVRAFVFYNAFGSWGWLDNLPQETRKRLDIRAGDIRDPSSVRSLVRDCEVVMHLAALIGIPYSYYSPDSYVETNVRGTLNVLEAAREFDVRRVIHTSTSEVYGTARFIPITEDHPLQAQSPYAASKIGADQLALSFYRSFQLPVTILRPFNTYGPRQSARAVVPTIITQAASGRSTVRLGDTRPTRDFSYVSDVVRAFVMVAQSDETAGEVLQVGSGLEISVGEVAELIARIMNVSIRIETEEARLRPRMSEVQRLCCDYSKMKRLTDWEPLFGGREGLERGLRETVKWFTHVENLMRYKPDAVNL